MGCHLQRVFLFSPDWAELLFQTNFLTVGTSLGRLSMKIFLDRTYRFDRKLDKGKREGAGGGVATPH